MRYLSSIGVLLAVCLGVGLGAAGCSSTKIALKESVFGIAKREQLVSSVKDTRDEQQDAKKQFASALDEFLAVTNAGANPSVREMEKHYNSLKDKYDGCVSQADDVRSKIKETERVADALFREWENELGQYSSAAMRGASERQLRDTRRQYDRLIGVMKDAASKMDPVLASFKDQVLFLKHNLNARAIASLQDTAAQVQTDVQRLIRDMEASIAEANAFIDQMGKSEG